jgi:uncharacterized integral membrane protein
MIKRYAIITVNSVGEKKYFCYYKLMGRSFTAFVPLFQHCILYNEEEVIHAEVYLLQIKKLNNVVKYTIQEV